jgi:hypothetical protein
MFPLPPSSKRNKKIGLRSFFRLKPHPASMALA